LKAVQLDSRELKLICSVLVNHASVTGAILFGSRAKGTATPSSDVDLAAIRHRALREHIERVGVRIYRQGVAV
jgi:uncharacterized protein